MGDFFGGIGGWIASWDFSWFPVFSQSSGFAGVLAVVAAVVAYGASTANSAKERWWKRAEYALNMTLSKDKSIRFAGLEMLDSMESRDRNERKFIRVALRWFLEDALVQMSTADQPAPTPTPAPGEQAASDIEPPTAEYVTPPPGWATRVGMRIDGIFSRKRP